MRKNDERTLKTTRVGQHKSELTKLDLTVKSQPEKPFATNLKVIISGDLYECYRYEIPIVKNLPPRTKHSGCNQIDRSSEYETRTGTRRFFAVKRLIHANFQDSFKFVTLTFRDEVGIDIRDVDQCHDYFINFIRRLKRRHKNLKYFCVLEFQDKNGRGAVHYHLIINLPYVPNDELSTLWGGGFIKINRRDLDSAAGYLAKYMSKSVRDPRLSGKRAYFRSIGLQNPIEKYGKEAQEIYSILENIKPVDTSSYQTEKNGQCHYAVYNKCNLLPNNSQ